MDVKAGRVKKLEGQLSEIAYGTRPYRLDTSKFEYSGGVAEEGEEGTDSVELERGQNLLQFNLSLVWYRSNWYRSNWYGIPIMYTCTYVRISDTTHCNNIFMALYLDYTIIQSAIQNYSSIHLRTYVQHQFF